MLSDVPILPETFKNLKSKFIRFLRPKNDIEPLPSLTLFAAAALFFVDFSVVDVTGGPSVVANECSFSNNVVALSALYGGPTVVGPDVLAAAVVCTGPAVTVHNLLMLNMHVIKMKLDEVKLKLITCWILL
ncbi:unnamed protein product [Ceratitis capitata]|uniref:(Mediterranean fruit fly) hypothetical protein n=1 Tax=Ceratitis capitata TaxID=7213 RepID=A0A811U418_CERCA|nr:unnamed protein product [Ceratitis capitata]